MHRDIKGMGGGACRGRGVWGRGMWGGGACEGRNGSSHPFTFVSPCVQGFSLLEAGHVYYYCFCISKDAVWRPLGVAHVDWENSACACGLRICTCGLGVWIGSVHVDYVD